MKTAKLAAVLATLGLAAALSPEIAGAEMPATPQGAADAARTAPLPDDALTFRMIDGKSLNLADLKAKAILVVNTASKCGYTPQYEGLEALYEARKDDGLVVIGVPSNDFRQEPGANAQIEDFCKLNYGVTFPLAQKTPVIGTARHPFYAAVQAALGDDATPKWNFYKVLLSGDGTPLKMYPSQVKPDDAALTADIDAALAG